MEPFERFVLVIVFIIFIILAAVSLLIGIDSALFGGNVFKPVLEYYIGSIYSAESGKWAMLASALVFFLIAMGLYYYDSKERHMLKAISTEGKLGVVSISNSAIEDYVEKVAIRMKDIKEIKARVRYKKDGIHVFCRTSVSSGANIPMLADRVGEEIKNSVEAIFGIFGIREVKIFVDKIITEKKTEDVQPGRRYY